MVKHALEGAGFNITGSGYDLETNTGDLIVLPPAGALPDEFHPATIPLNLPEGPGAPGVV